MHASGQRVGSIVGSDVSEEVQATGAFSPWYEKMHITACRGFKRWEDLAARHHCMQLAGHVERTDVQVACTWVADSAKRQDLWNTVLRGHLEYKVNVDAEGEESTWWRKQFEQGGGPDPSRNDVARWTEDPTSGSILAKVYETVSSKTFFVTDSGHMGTGWKRVGSDPVHIICVLAGGHLPVVLKFLNRPCPHCGNKKTAYEFVGPAYVQGTMQGEAIKYGEDGTVEWEDFCLM